VATLGAPWHPGPGVTIVTWNVNGIRARHAQVRQLVDERRPDVVCLQELKATPEQVPDTVCALPGYRCYWHGARAYSGVALLVRTDRFPAAAAVTHPAFDHETRIAEIDLGDVAVASVYVPNGGKDFAAKMAFLDAMTAWAAALGRAGRRLLVCGDVNIAREERDVHPKERKPGAIGQRPDERAAFARLLATGLVDVGRALAPDDDALFTWWAPWRSLRQRNIGWRLDYVLATDALAATATACTVLREFGTSDHGPVVATFEP
jgi:exodeoxyribonuclease-3